MMAHPSPPPPCHSRQGLPGWSAVTPRAQGGWRCGGDKPGPASARTMWTSRPPRWCAGSWAAARCSLSMASASLGQERGRSGTCGSSAPAPKPSSLPAPGSRPTAPAAPATLASSAPVSAGGTGGCWGSPRNPVPPANTVSLPQLTRVSGWRATAAVPGGWRWRWGGRGGPSVPPAGTCPMPTSSAATSAVAPPSPCPQEAPSAGGTGRCGAMASVVTGLNGTRASAPWQCWGSPHVPPVTPLPSTAQVCLGTALRGFWGTLKLGSGRHRVILGEGRAEPPSPQGLNTAGAAAPRHRRGFCRRCGAPAAGGGGEPVRRAAGGDREPRDMGPRDGGAMGHRAWQRGVPAAGLWRAGQSLCHARLGHRGAAVCRHRGEPGTVQRLWDGHCANRQPRGGGRRLLG